jgi:hypothetical protein
MSGSERVVAPQAIRATPGSRSLIEEWRPAQGGCARARTALAMVGCSLTAPSFTDPSHSAG